MTSADRAPTDLAPARGDDVPFARQMALTPDAGRPGRYLVDVEPRWNCPIVPQGGVMAALAATAMQTELAHPDQRLRTLTTVFAAQVPAGPVAIDVSVLRRGRTMSQAMATARPAGAGPDATGHTTIAVFGADRGGFEFTDLVMPEVDPPEACPSFRDPPPPGVADNFPERPPFEFWDHVEGRAAFGNAPWDDYEPTTSDCGHWYRIEEPPMLPDGTLDPRAVIALCDLMPSSVGQRMGPSTRTWYPPSTDLTVHLFEDARSEWLLAHLRARRATEGYASVECALWDPTGPTLVAHAAQVMFLSFPDGVPTGDERFPPDQRP